MHSINVADQIAILDEPRDFKTSDSRRTEAHKDQGHALGFRGLRNFTGFRYMRAVFPKVPARRFVGCCDWGDKLERPIDDRLQVGFRVGVKALG